MTKKFIFGILFQECRSKDPLSNYIRQKLEQCSQDERKEIVSRVKNGCAPLFLACEKGNLEIMEYLINYCDADVNQRGMYVCDRSTHFVTPLWCASVTGRLNVVKFLVEHGANINSVSDTGSTPVRSACYYCHNDIVEYLVEHNADILKPNYDGNTCLMSSIQSNSIQLCKFLIGHGANVNSQDIECKTALHFAIEAHRFDITKLLLENGADPFIKDRYGDDALVTACLNCENIILDYLCENYNFSKQRIAEVHELIGSRSLKGFPNLKKCLYHWQLALSIRYSDPNNIITKNFVKKASYTDITEFNTYEELENVSMDLDAMHIQSLLVCERILGPLHEETIFRFLCRSKSYADSLKFQHSINLLRYLLELRIQKDGLLDRGVCFVAQALVKIFLIFCIKHQTGMVREQVEFTDVWEFIRMLLCHFENANKLLKIRPIFQTQQDDFDKMLEVLIAQIFILYMIPKSPEQIKSMKQLFRDILQLDFRTSTGDTLLHLVVSKSNITIRNYFFMDPHIIISPNATTVELLLKCGANVEAINYNLRSPLHIASFKSNFTPEIIQVLLKYGAHIDRRDCYGNYPSLHNIYKCNIKPLEYTTLQCFAARKIMKENISFIGKVPVHLEEFIKIH